MSTNRTLGVQCPKCFQPCFTLSAHESALCKCKSTAVIHDGTFLHVYSDEPFDVFNYVVRNGNVLTKEFVTSLQSALHVELPSTALGTKDELIPDVTKPTKQVKLRTNLTPNKPAKRKLDKHLTKALTQHENTFANKYTADLYVPTA